MCMVGEAGRVSWITAVAAWRPRAQQQQYLAVAAAALSVATAAASATIATAISTAAAAGCKRLVWSDQWYRHWCPRHIVFARKSKLEEFHHIGDRISGPRRPRHSRCYRMVEAQLQLWI